MKTFLEAWLQQAQAILRRELSGEVQLLAAESLPPLSSARSLSILVSGSAKGAFTITVDRDALHAVLAAARMAESHSDGDRDWELWCELVKQMANGALQGLEGAAIAPAEEASWRLGLSSAAYELHVGSVRMRVAFTDQVRMGGLPDAAKVVSGNKEEKGGQVDLLLDIELEASLRFGSREMPLSEVLELGPGDVVELDRHVADPVDLIVGDKIVAHGEVVLVNGNFGLRVTRVAEPKKCLESIRCLF